VGVQGTAERRDHGRSVGGKAVEGTIFPAGPVVVASLLPDSHPSKVVGLAYIKDYEANNKTPFAGFGAHLADCATILLVEQNARAALQVADYADVMELGEITMHGPAEKLAADKAVIESYLGFGKH
jgi:hypothetical protein